MLDLLYPRKCVVCGEVLDESEDHLCSGCLQDMPLTYYWTWRENPAEKILWGRTYLQSVVSLFFYKKENNYKNLIHRIKYNGDIHLGRKLGRMLGEYMCTSFFEDIDIIVPVPLHWRKKWKRGYNQAEVIAQGIALGMGGKPLVKGLLKRKRFTPSQTKISMGSKWENMQNAFSLVNARINGAVGKHILLVDDVLTSGATTEACFDVLSEIPLVKVSLATLAYVDEN